MTNQQKSIYRYCLRLGDSALIHSCRLSEWCSNAPILEEELALTNFALDMIGRASALLKYAAELEGSGKTEDDIAYRRSERGYYNSLLTEIPNGDFAQTMARLLYVSTFEFYQYSELQHSKDETLAAIAAKTLKEIKYHLAHAEDWVKRLGDGTEESHGRMQKAINDLWMYTGDLFDMNDDEAALVENGIAVDLNTMEPKWYAHISKTLADATLKLPTGSYMQTGSRQGIHTEHLGHILSEMQYLQRAYPDATW